MRFFETRTIINAPRETLWHILVDGPRLASGDFGIIRLEGRIGQGETIKLWSEVSPKRAFPLKVAVLDEPSHMVWTGGMPLGLFKGVRTFTLTPHEGGIVHFELREEFSGLLFPLFAKSLPDMTEPFEGFCAGLKARAEA